MNLPIETEENVDSRIILDYWSLDQVNITEEKFWNYYKQVREQIEQVKSTLATPEEIKRVTDRLIYISNIIQFQKSGNTNVTNIDKLKYLQDMSILWYINFLIWSFFHENKTWFMVMPTGQWKTLLSLILADLNPNKTIIITDNNIWTDQFISASQGLTNIDASASVIDTQNDNTDNCIISGWYNFFKSIEQKTINFLEYSTIFIDEVDVNGLSEKRQDFLQKIQKEYWINIVWMSATEQQGSGKKITDFYKYDILSFPMPQSLPELHRMWEIPNIHFKDVYLNAELQLSKANLTENEEEIDYFIKNSDWIQQIFDYHLQKNHKKKFILWMKNNSLNSFILKVAQTKWIRLASLTGDTPQTERTEIVNKLKNGELDWILWCKLTWRWLDIPECEVVYNSLLTYAPQLFWQLAGRAARFDQTQPLWEKEIVTFLPKSVLHKENKTKNGKIWKNISTQRAAFPLCFWAFFNPKYFSHPEKSWMHISDEKEYNLWALDETKVVSLQWVSSMLEAYNTYWSFSGRPEVLANLILSIDRNLSYHILQNYVLRVKSEQYINNFYSKNEDVTESDQEHKKEIFENYQKYLSMYKWNNSESLTVQKEKQLFKNYFSEKDIQKKNTIAHDIISYHYDIIIAIACKIDTQWIPLDDVIQSWVLAILEKMDNFKNISRFSSFCSLYAFTYMQTYIQNNASEIRIPISQQEIREKIERALGNYDKQSQNSENWDFNNGKKKISYIAEQLWKSEVEIKEILKIHNETYETFDEEDIIINNWILRYEEHGASSVGEDRKIYNWIPLWIRASETNTQDTPPDSIIKQGLQESVRDVLSWLTSRERKVLEIRFWLLKNLCTPTLEEVWTQLNVSRTRIEQIEKEALRKLRNPWRSSHLRSFLDE